MSKLLAGIVAVGLVLVSFGIIGGVLEKDADAEDSYAKYSISGEEIVETWWGIESPMATMTGTAVFKVLGAENGMYEMNEHWDINGIIDTEGLTIDDVIGDLPLDSFERTDKRVGIGGTVTYQWEYSVDGEKYCILSGEDVIDTIYGLTAITDLIIEGSDVQYKNDLRLDASGNVISWTSVYCIDFLGQKDHIRYFYPELEGDVEEMDTKFGKKGIIRTTEEYYGDIIDQVVFADSKILYEEISETMRYVLSSTNIKL